MFKIHTYYYLLLLPLLLPLCSDNTGSSPKESFTYSPKSPPMQLHSPPITNRPILMPYGAADDGSVNNRSQQILRAGPSHSHSDRRNNMGMQDRNRHTMGASGVDRHMVSSRSTADSLASTLRSSIPLHRTISMDLPIPLGVPICTLTRVRCCR